MNWGYKILVVYVLFMAGIIFLVFKSSSQNQDLVAKDYYEQELKYQDKIDETERANALSQPVKFEIGKDSINIMFPAEMNASPITAHIILYCPSDKSKDIERLVKTVNGLVQLPIQKNNKGLHELKLSWQVNGTGYYFEHKLFIQ